MPIDYKKIVEEIEAGLPNSRKERDDAAKNADFHAIDFDRWPVKNRDGRYQTDAVPHPSAVFRRICDVLCGNLYKHEPTRVLGDEVASEFVAKIYKRQRMRARWKRADALTLVGGVQAFQYAGGESPEDPVTINQWGRHEFQVWTDPDDALKVEAVATIDKHNGGGRLRLWTRESVTTFERRKGVEHEAFGEATWQKPRKRDNPYRRVVVTYTGEEEEGVIPFSFAHWDFPCQTFETSSPGDLLAAFNEHVNRRLYKLGDAIEYQSEPLAWGKGLTASFKWPAKIKPGDFIDLVSDADVVGNDPSGGADLGFLVPPTEHITINWQELNSRLDHLLEMLGVPQSAIRMVQSGAASGLAIQSEQLPLITWAEGRQGDWQSYEEDAAKTCLLIAEAHARSQGAASEADKIKRMLDPWEFSLRWPKLYTQLPGPERDRSDGWRLEQGLASKVTILMEREGFTEDESFAYLERLQEQNQRLEAMGIEARPPKPQFGGFGQDQQNQRLPDTEFGEDRPPEGENP